MKTRLMILVGLGLLATAMSAQQRPLTQWYTCPLHGFDIISDLQWCELTQQAAEDFKYKRGFYAPQHAGDEWHTPQEYWNRQARLRAKSDQPTTRPIADPRAEERRNLEARKKQLAGMHDKKSQQELLSIERYQRYAVPSR